jgi:hypothetical protein
METWKEIEGFKGNYLVSDLGRVKSSYAIIVRKDGTNHTRVSKILKPGIDNKGYSRVAMMHEGRLITKKVHRLVAAAFVPNPERKPQVNHLSGVKTDNRIENLEWVTNDENIKHAIDNGIIKMSYSADERRRSVNKVIKRGSLNGVSKLTEKEVTEIKRDYIPGVNTRKMLGVKYNVSFTTIKDIVNGRTWTHIK